MSVDKNFLQNKNLLQNLANGWEGMHSPEPWSVMDPEEIFGSGTGWDDNGMWVQAAPGSLPNPQPGDWAIDALSVCDISHSDGEGPASDLMRANAARISACVNFCRGFSNDALAKTTLREVLEEVLEQGFGTSEAAK